MTVSDLYKVRKNKRALGTYINNRNKKNNYTNVIKPKSDTEFKTEHTKKKKKETEIERVKTSFLKE